MGSVPLSPIPASYLRASRGHLSQWDLCRSLATNRTIQAPVSDQASLCRPHVGTPSCGSSSPPHPTPSVHQPSSPLDAQGSMRSAAQVCTTACPRDSQARGALLTHTLLLVSPSFSLQSPDSPAPALLCCGVVCDGLGFAANIICFFIHFHFV